MLQEQSLEGLYMRGVRCLNVAGVRENKFIDSVNFSVLFFKYSAPTCSVNVFLVIHRSIHGLFSA